MLESVSPDQALAIVDNCPFPVLLVDQWGQAVGSNQAFARLVGTDQLAELRRDTAAMRSDHPLYPLVKAKESVCWTDQNGKQRHFKIHSMLVPDSDRLGIRFFIDNSAEVALERSRQALGHELAKQTLNDTLTGLLNQRGLMLALEPLVARSRRYDSPISVVMMEIRSDKQQEDLTLLVARLLKDQLRWADLIATADQQKFLLILPETTSDAALKLTAKLDLRLAELCPRQLPGREIHTRFGVTGWRKNDNADSLLERAATALAQARSEPGKKSISL
ncbi:GGDEF domain-containing protein [Thiogranum longum]